MGEDGTTLRREISAATTGILLRFVRDHFGRDALRDVLFRSGVTRTLQELGDPAQWCSYDDAMALFEAAVAVSGDPRLGLRVGAEMLRQHRGTPVEAALRSLGSPAEVLRNIVTTASKFTSVTTSEALEVGDTEALVSVVTVPGFVRHPVYCDYVAGLLTQVSVLFGLPPALVREEECQARGASRCLYRVSWDNAPDAVGARLRQLEARAADLSARVDSMQSSVTDLVSADDLDEVLRRIAARAGTAVKAMAYLLVVAPTDDAPPRLISDGLSTHEAEALARAILGSDPASLEASSVLAGSLAIEVVSARRRYGTLLAVGPPGAEFFPEEQRQLGAYGRLAAAALDVAVALEEMRRRGELAAALLELARSLARAGSQDEVYQRLAAAVPSVARAPQSAVLIWHDDPGELRVAAHAGFEGEKRAMLDRLVVRPADTPEVGGMLANPRPQYYLADSEDPFVRGLLGAFGAGATAVIPILVRDRFLGTVVAVWPADQAVPPFDDDLVARLSGLADQAAIAAANSRLMEQITHQAFHDRLTGLPNEALFHDRLEHALARARRARERLGVLFLDLDRFKRINDGLGHPSGNDLLCQAAARIRAALRDVDTTARWGGDEFVVLVEDIRSEDQLRRVGEKLVESFRVPFDLDGQEVRVTASVGAALFPDDEGDAGALLRAADRAMYGVKAAGRDGFRSAGPRTGSTAYVRLSMETDLRRAVEQGELVAHFQPQVELATGRIVAAHTVVRWAHPTLGLVQPAEVVAVAEDTGLAIDIDALALRVACRQAKAWTEAGCPVRVAVTLSPHHRLQLPRLAWAVGEAVSEAGVDPTVLELEVTEDFAVGEMAATAALLHELHDQGITFTLNDFGTGSYALDRLRRLPVDRLRIGAPLVNEIQSGQEAPLVAAIAALAGALDLGLVADGVERDYQRGVLVALGCERGQGHLFGPPVVGEELTGRLVVQRSRSGG